MKRKHRPTYSSARLYGGVLFGWTWPIAATLARLRTGWYPWLAFGGAIVAIGFGIVTIFVPNLNDGEEIITVFGLAVGGPFMFVLLVFMTAPLAARWRWAEQQLLLNWATRRGAEVTKRTEYWDFASTEWDGSDRVRSDAPILAYGTAIGFPTLVSFGPVTLGRAALRLRSAMLRTGRSRGSRDLVVFAFVPVDVPSSVEVDRICCWRRGPSTMLQSHLLEQLRGQSFESERFDARIRVGIGAGDDALLVRRLLDPVTIERFAASDTVWEFTGRGVTAYRRTRVKRGDDLDQLVSDAVYLAHRFRDVLPRHGSRQIGAAS